MREQQLKAEKPSQLPSFTVFFFSFYLNISRGPCLAVVGERFFLHRAFSEMLNVLRFDKGFQRRYLVSKFLFRKEKYRSHSNV